MTQDLLTAAKEALKALEQSVITPNSKMDTREYVRCKDQLRTAIEEAEEAEPAATWERVARPGAVFDQVYLGPPRKWEDAWSDVPSRSLTLEFQQPLYSHPAPTIPPGWQLVPKEPTEEMEAAASEANSAWGFGKGNRYAWNYKAMLAAAPKYEGEGK